MSYGTQPGLTDAQRKVLDYVIAYRAAHQCPPSRWDISDHFGWRSANAAQDHLLALERKGYLKLIPSRARGIFLC